jgi:uncharacterized phage protein gp47/JayE
MAINFNDILTTPTLDDLSNQVESDLKADNFKIKNFRVGRIFKTLYMILLKTVVDLYVMLVDDILPNMYLSDATTFWLDLKAKEYGKERKQATKTEGMIAVSRIESDGAPKKIPEDTIFKTIDANNNELRFLATETVIMEKDDLKVYVPVIAEFPGAIYNVAQGMVTSSLQHLPGIDVIENEADWLIKEGSDTEDDESLRNRCLNAWSELSSQLTSSAYWSIASEVEGVIVVRIDDEHPRGQGTIDIIIISSAGLPTQALLDEVETNIDEVKGPYDDVLVMGPDPVYQDIDVTLYIDEIYGDETEAYNLGMAKIDNLFNVDEDNSGYKLYRANIIDSLMSVNNAINVIVNLPDSDIVLDSKKLIMPGTITLNIIKEGS